MMKYMRAPAEERFERLYIPEPNSGCWLWIGNLDNCGYGRFSFEGRARLSHRASYQMFCGPIPEGMQILHRCDNPTCVNPDHLFAGSISDNMRDMVAKNRNAKHNNAKLDADQIKEIKFLAAQGLRHRKIAEQFKVTRSSISNAIAGRTWGA